MTENEARPTAGGPVHRRYCGECGTRIDQLCPKCYPAAQPEPPKGLREAVERASYKIFAKYEVCMDTLPLPEVMCKTILAAVGPVVEAREKLLWYFLVMVPRHEYKCTCMLCNKVAEAQALIGGKDE